ncbi:MAG: hypothetical protein ACI3V3_01445 [Faecousia sp.]
MRKLRATILMIVIIAIVVASFSFTVSAQGTGVDLTYWYSDASDIGYFSSASISVYAGSNSSWNALSPANIKSYAQSAFSSWSFTGRSASYVGSQQSAKLAIGGITSTEASQAGIPSNALGVTYPNRTYVFDGYYGTAIKKIYKVTSADIVLIERSVLGNSTSNYKKVLIHELGHAFGYFGHYSGGNIMPVDFSGITSTTPSTNEKHHLKQTY